MLKKDFACFLLAPRHLTGGGTAQQVNFDGFFNGTAAES